MDGTKGFVGHLKADIDYAEAFAFGVSHDDVVRVGRAFVPVDFRGAELFETLYLGSLVFGVKIEMNAGRDVA
jgi:hypothetical protein